MMKRILLAALLTMAGAHPAANAQTIAPAAATAPVPAVTTSVPAAPAPAASTSTPVPAAATTSVPAPTPGAAVPTTEGQPGTGKMTATVTKSRELRNQNKQLSSEQRKRLSAREHLTASALIPFKIVAVSTAAAVGTPIAIVRCEAQRMRTYTTAVNDELSALDGSLPLVVSSVPGQSLRAVGTIGEGILNGLFNASEGWSHPLSRESFSLGVMYPID